jgi:hypothetical protein
LLKVWPSGSRREDVGVADVGSLKSHAQAVGVPPPDVSRKTTVNGAVPDRVDGETAALPVKAAEGGMPGPEPAPGSVMPDLTGNTDDAETLTDPPTILEITGVITWNWQVMLTCAVSPISYLPSASASEKVGGGAVWTPATLGRSQFEATASPRI